MSTDDPASVSDQDYLDLVFERAVERLEAGQRPVPLELPAGREHLRQAGEDLLRLAEQVAIGPARPQPRLPDYEIVGELGRGGMGTVYLARQERLGGRLVALKLLPAGMVTPRARQRFIHEARAIARLRHPNVVGVYDVSSEGQDCAFAMEWIDGRSLAEVIEFLRARSREHEITDRAAQFNALREFLRAPPGTLTDPSVTLLVCRAGISIARALEAVHSTGLLHRDVKPSNILLRRDGTALLSDFGLVRDLEATVTEPGHFAGTALYASPEQLRAQTDRLDARSDVYSLGVTLYHALALEPPWRARVPHEILREIEAGAATPLRRADPRLPRDLETIIAKAMDPDPARRYQTADALADDLERMLALQPIKARPAGMATRGLKFLRRHRAASIGIALSSLVTLALAVALGVYLFLVPGWVATHVRDARLALLDPSHGGAMTVSAHFGYWPTTGPLAPRIADEALVAAVRHYDAALRLAPMNKSLRVERETVNEALLSRHDRRAPSGALVSSAKDPRNLGLRDFLAGDFDAALAHWERSDLLRAPSSEPDPLVEAALGILYLVRDQPARAYPRLRDACQAFPGVGFLTVSHADAAFQCGDLETSERLLASATGMARPDVLGTSDRLQANLLAARGRDQEAERSYLRFDAPTPAGIHLLWYDYARFLESRGRTREALRRFGMVAMDAPRGLRPARAYVEAMDRWWATASGADRRRCLRAALDENPFDASSFAAQLRLYMQCRERVDGSTSPRRSRRARGIDHIDLPSLADILEIHDTALWFRLLGAPALAKACYAAAWGSVPELRVSAWVTRGEAIAALIGSVRSSTVVHAIAALGGSVAHGPAVGTSAYDALLGTPPHEQGWPLCSDTYPHAEPSVAMVGGSLYLSTTMLEATDSTGGTALWFREDIPIDFHAPGGAMAEIRTRVIHSDYAVALGHGWPRPGYSLSLIDRAGHVVILGLGDSRVFLSNDVYGVFGTPGTVEADFNTTDGFHTYRIEASAAGASLFIDGAPSLSLRGLGPSPGARDHGRVEFGDPTYWANSETLTAFVAVNGAPPCSNASPIARAGPDRSVLEGMLVALDASDSSIPGDTHLYAWSQRAGPRVTLTVTSPACRTFTAPPSAVGECLVFRLIVGNGRRLSEPADVRIAVTASPTSGRPR